MCLCKKWKSPFIAFRHQTANCRSVYLTEYLTTYTTYYIHGVMGRTCSKLLYVSVLELQLAYIITQITGSLRHIYYAITMSLQCNYISLTCFGWNKHRKSLMCVCTCIMKMVFLIPNFWVFTRHITKYINLFI